MWQLSGIEPETTAPSYAPRVGVTKGYRGRVGGRVRVIYRVIWQYYCGKGGTCGGGGGSAVVEED